jgi:hypothetical protein
MRDGNKPEGAQGVALTPFMRFEFIAVAYIVSRGRTNLQRRLLAAALKVFFNSAKFLSVLLAGLIHVYTIIFAYRYGGRTAAMLTAVLPGASQVYWLGRLWLDGNNVAYLYGVALLIFGGVIYALRKISPMDISVSYF